MWLFKPNVSRMQAQKNVDGLVKALSDREVEIREAAARALGELAFPRVVIPLCNALKDKEWTVRLTSVEALAKINDPRAVDPISAMLKDEKPAIHKAAAETLVKFGPQAVNALARALNDKEVHARVNAAWALGQVKGAHAAVPVLCNALKAPEPNVRLAVVEALAAIADKRAIEPLSGVLLDSERNVAEAAASALQKIGLPTDPASQAKFAVARADWNRAVQLGAVAIDALVEACQSPSQDIRRNAAKSLGMIGDVRGAQILLKLLDDEEWFVRESAAWSLGHIQDHRISGVLCAALKEKSVHVREAAAKALAERGDPATIPALVGAFDDPEFPVVEAAADALAKMGSVALGPLLTTFKDASSGVRHAVSRALEQIGEPDDPTAQAWFAIIRGDWAKAIQLGDLAVEPLIAALRDDDHRMRRAAAETLGQIGQIGAVRAIEPLCRTLRDRKADVRKAIAEVLVKIGQPAVDSLIYALNDEEWTARESAAWALGQIGDMWSVGPLCDALQDPHSAVAEAAADALDVIGLPEDPEILAWYVVAKRDWTRIVNMGTHASAPLLHAAKDVNPDIRWHAVRALAQLRDPETICGLRELLQDEESYVREAATDALASMGVSVGEPAEPECEPDADAAPTNEENQPA